MDPNANLREMIEIANKIVFDPYDRYDTETVRLAELVVALDDWLKKGNALPLTWDHGRRPW
ncbi:MAG: hypothetical protein WC565_03845 [Parcubacteria group bacterium]